MSKRMQNWLLSKVLAYLEKSEGCDAETEEQVSDSTSSIIIQDAFGFRYQIQVRLLGRIQEEPTSDAVEFTDLFKRMSSNSRMEVSHVQKTDETKGR
jgi:hypothetical protein